VYTSTACECQQWRCVLLCVTIGSYSVAYAEYVLMEPSQAYHSIMATVHEKIYLSKVRPGDIQLTSKWDVVAQR